MAAAVFHAAGDVRIARLPVPMCRPNQALVRVLWCGLCGSDLEEYRDGPVVLPTTPHPLTGRQVPLVLGHEFVGVVERPATDGSGAPAGAVVVPDVISGCGRCWWCTHHEEGLCPDLAVLGQHADGGLAEYVAARADRLVLVPEHVPVEAAALVEPLAVAVRAARAAGPLLGRGAVVLGAGPVGQLVARVFDAGGAYPVVVVDPAQHRRTLALRGGAGAALPPGPPAAIIRLFPPRGVDVVVEATGVVGQVATAITVVRRGGTVVLLGVQPRPEAVDVLDLVLHEKTVRGSAAHMYDDDVQVAVDLLARGAVDVTGLVTHRIRLDDVVTEGFQRLASAEPETLKVLVECTTSSSAPETMAEEGAL